MKIIANQRSWKYGFWLSPFLIAAGLTVGFVSEEWGMIPFILIVIGVAIAIIWLLWQSKRTNWWAKRSTQAGTNAILATTAVVVILGLINFLGTRYSVRQDLTETQLFTLAPQSQELVRSLDSPVKVWVFDVTQNPRERELLANYQRQSSKFKFEYVEPQAKPGLVKRFGVEENNGKAFLESGERRVKVVDFNEPLTEVKLTNRLQQLASANTLKVYFLQGHGEHPLDRGNNAMSQAVKSLSDRNFIADPLTLTDKSQVPNDAAVVIVAGASQDLFPNEVKALQAYLNSGGNLLLMIDPGTDPKLDPLLNEWGVTVDSRLAVDVSGSAALGPAVPLVTTYGQHPITKDFGNNISFYQLARPIETKTVEAVQASPLLLTKPYPNSWAESDLQSETLQFDQEGDRKGPLTLGVALTRKVVEKPTTPKPQGSPSPTPTPSPQASPSPSPTPTTQAKVTDRETRLVVIGNSRFATDAWFQRALNGDVFLNSVTWLSQQDTQPLSIRPKEAKDRRINISPVQAGLLRISSLIVLPLIGIVGAILLWLQRR